MESLTVILSKFSAVLAVSSAFSLPVTPIWLGIQQKPCQGPN